MAKAAPATAVPYLDRLPPLPVAASGRLGVLRSEGAARFKATGLPGMRQERWRFTPLTALAKAGFDPGEDGAEAATPLDAALLTGLAALPAEGFRLVLANGRVVPELTVLPEGAALGGHGDEAALGALADIAASPMIALNSAGIAEPAVLRLKGSIAQPIALVQLAAPDAASLIQPRLLVAVAEGAEATLIEHAVSDDVPVLVNSVVEILVGPAAKLTHVRRLRGGAETVAIHSVAVRVGEGGQYEQFTLASGGKLQRSDSFVTLAAPNATVHLNGIYLGRGHEHQDLTSQIVHAAPDCRSNQTVKGALADRAKGVFQGRIQVDRDAQRTDGYQLNRALLLSRTAEVNAKPELEIYADDVKCSHGATVGELDDTALFYLRSRGLPKADARRLLIEAYLGEALDLVESEAARAVLQADVDAWLSGVDIDTEALS